MDRPSRSPLAVHWGLDPETVFLNHGSFGATPTAIREEQRFWQDRMELEPVAFLDGEGLERMVAARHALAFSHVGPTPPSTASGGSSS